MVKKALMIKGEKDSEAQLITAECVRRIAPSTMVDPKRPRCVIYLSDGGSIEVEGTAVDAAQLLGIDYGALMRAK